MVKKIRTVCLAILGAVAVSFGATTLFDFENVAVGEIPAGWKVESLNKPGPLATYACAVNATVPGAQAGNHVMKVTAYASESAYGDCHICWTDAVSFQNGTIEVDAMATGGSTSENYAGLAWRIQDKNNYYALRFSAAEGSVSVFRIVNGVRGSSIASADRAFVAGTWYHLKLIQTGNTFTISVDNTQILSVTNPDITAAGGVGLFMRSKTTKAEWDNLSITIPGTSVRPYSNSIAQRGTAAGKTTVNRMVNLQGKEMPFTPDNFGGMSEKRANATYYGVDPSTNRATSVLKIKK